MYLKRLEISGFKSFAKKSVLEFTSPISAIVGPNGSGKSNIAEAIRFVLGEQSLKSLRGKKGEDLIFSGSKNLGRLNRAKVSIVFDNTDRVLDIDYDEVVIAREVHRDSSHQYFINGSQVRLKDVIEILSSMSIGASGHHIISQGEADRILSASSKEKKTMVEDALGLRIYHLKIAESERKLSKTEDNIKHIRTLRKEIAPHIRFLKIQVDKIQKVRDLRKELTGLYKEYLKREEGYIAREKKELEEKGRAPKQELAHLKKELTGAQALISSMSRDGEEKKKKELLGMEEKLSSIREQKNELSRELGHLEGVIEYEEKRARIKKEREGDEEKPIPFREVNVFVRALERNLEEAGESGSISEIKTILGRAGTLIADFVSRCILGGTKEEVSERDNEEDSEDMKREREAIHASLEDIDKKEHILIVSYEDIKQEIEKEKDASRDSETAVFKIKARESELLSRISMVAAREERVLKEEQLFKEELQEGAVLVGKNIIEYAYYPVSPEEAVREPRDLQENRRRKIEKIKIRLEDSGSSSGEDVIKEHEEATERDKFLEREVDDLEKSTLALKALISELEEKLGRQFQEGIEKINTQFQGFFSAMFGGGSAKLSVVAEKKRKKISAAERGYADMNISDATDDESVAEEGIEIDVRLPRKKTNGLQMLSGGERALTSIALLFAVSQVKPPPFLVLDETDAALDEANSRKYGDMLGNLSAYSQLIVITHNRETMARAGILYGVTMDSDAVSKLLSIKFEEAETYAKK
ncbi:MAG: hypothetical protein BMS9Abin13_252 [Patescibacteria group bacterium]|nr:MAG: hypothetical protein BMS9Abin13_252 [Patescibacteria group bacterium]